MITYRDYELAEFAYVTVRIVDLSLKLYVGSTEDKTRALRMLAKFGKLIKNEGLLGIAKNHFKKLAEDTKLRYVIKGYEEIWGWRV